MRVRSGPSKIRDEGSTARTVNYVKGWDRVEELKKVKRGCRGEVV